MSSAPSWAVGRQQQASAELIQAARQRHRAPRNRWSTLRAPARQAPTHHAWQAGVPVAHGTLRSTARTRRDVATTETYQHVASARCSPPPPRVTVSTAGRGTGDAGAGGFLFQVEVINEGRCLPTLTATPVAEGAALPSQRGYPAEAGLRSGRESPLVRGVHVPGRPQPPPGKAKKRKETILNLRVIPVFL